MKAGAFDFFTKPFCVNALLSAIRQAIEHSRTELDREVEINQLRDRFASLTRREREVMALVVSGLLNKQVGFELGISESTVKAHRGQMMRKMKARSLAGLSPAVGSRAVFEVCRSGLRTCVLEAP